MKKENIVEGVAVFVALIVLISVIVGLLELVVKGGLTISKSINILSDVATIIVAYIMWLTVKVTQNLEKERLRPRIVFDFVFSLREKCVYAEVRNEGLTSATHVIFEIPDKITEMGKRGVAEFPFKYPITHLSPNDKKRTFLAPSGAFFKIHKEPIFIIGVSYKDAGGKKYSEKITHNLNYMKHSTWLTGHYKRRELGDENIGID